MMEREETRRVLIVEDDPAYNYLLAKQFSLSGYEVFNFQTGAEAAEFLKANTIDAIVLDYELPDMTGFKVASLVRAIPELKDTPIIVVSAHSKFDLVDAAAASGVWNMMFRKKITPIGDLIKQTKTAIEIAEVRKWMQHG